MNQPLINILIRTSNRPNHFKRLLRSIYRQSYKNVRVIVSIDDEAAYRYAACVKGVTIIDLTGCYSKKEPAFYNRYCNDLMQEVKEGVFFFADDDDYIIDKDALLKVSEHLQEDKALIVQMSRFRTKVMPRFAEIKHSRIGLPCIVLHSKFKDLATFEGQMDSDYWFIKEVTDKIGFEFREIVLMECGKRGYGKPL